MNQLRKCAECKQLAQTATYPITDLHTGIVEFKPYCAQCAATTLDPLTSHLCLCGHSIVRKRRHSSYIEWFHNLAHQSRRVRCYHPRCHCDHPRPALLADMLKAKAIS